MRDLPYFRMFVGVCLSPMQILGVSHYLSAQLLLYGGGTYESRKGWEAVGFVFLGAVVSEPCKEVLCAFLKRGWLPCQQNDEGAYEPHYGEGGERYDVALPEVEHKSGEEGRENHRNV